MADNVTLSAGTADGAVIAADDVTGVWYQIQKLAFGALDSVTLAASGAGAVTAGVQRVTLASDDPVTTAIQIMDDWDESDRAKVNLIVGQAGIAAGAGAVGATVPRVTLASDDPGVALLGTIDTDTGNIATSLAVMDDWDNGASDGASVSGDVAHDGADAGEPVKIGGYASAAAPTGVSADADRVNAWFLRNGAQATVITAAGALIGGDATNGLDVDVTRVTGTVTVDGSGVTQPVSHAALTELAAAIDTELQVDVVGALPAGNNNIGDVDVASVVPGTGATNLGKAEDAAHTTGDVGVMALSVRQDTAAALGGADADYQPLITDASGRLHVTVGNTVTVGSHAVTNAGTFATQVDGAALTALQLIDNIVLVEDAAASGGESGVQVFAVRKDSAGTLASADGDFTPLQVDASGSLRVTGGGGGTEYTEDAAGAADPVGTALILVRQDTPTALTSANGDNVAMRGTDYGAAYVTLLDTGGSPVSVGGGTQYTEDAAAAANPIGNALNLIRDDSLARTVSADGDNVAAGGSAAGALYVEIVGGTTKLGSATDGLLVNLGANNDVTVTGTVTANLAAGTNTNEVVGDVAHDAAIAGNPVIIGARASAAVPTDVSADDDAVRLWALRSGALAVQPTFAGVLATTGNGASGTGVQRVTIANDSTGLISVNPGTAANWGVYVEDAAETAGGNLMMAGSVRRDTAASSAGTSGDNATVNTDATGNLWVTGTQLEDVAHTTGDKGHYVLAVRDDSLAAHSGTDGDYESLHTTAEGALWATITPTTTGGLTIHKSIDLDESEEEVKATAGVVYSIAAFNRTAAPVYLKLYNATAANVTVGTTTPVATFVVPANADSDGAGFIWESVHGLGFGTAICAAATTGVADNDTGAPGANDCVVVIGFK